MGRLPYFFLRRRSIFMANDLVKILFRDLHISHQDN